MNKIESYNLIYAAKLPINIENCNKYVIKLMIYSKKGCLLR